MSETDLIAMGEAVLSLVHTQFGDRAGQALEVLSTIDDADLDEEYSTRARLFAVATAEDDLDRLRGYARLATGVFGDLFVDAVVPTCAGDESVGDESAGVEHRVG